MNIEKIYKEDNPVIGLKFTSPICDGNNYCAHQSDARLLEIKVDGEPLATDFDETDIDRFIEFLQACKRELF